MKSPVFIFSLPRSGSTLLQRVLSGHVEVATASEPWIMLPFCYASIDKGVLSEYIHDTSNRAVVDFINGIGRHNYNESLNIFITSLYQKHCFKDEKYFIDKTPRYYLIIKEIKDIFPDAKFIFLFRNPLHVMGSIISTFSSGGLGRLYPYDIDLTLGINCLAKGYDALKDISYALKYEDFISEPVKYTKEICDYLEVQYQPSMLEDLSKRNMDGLMGDPIKSNITRSVDNTSLAKWRKTCSGIYRKKVVKSYMSKVSEEAFLSQGYSKIEIIKDAESLDGHFSSLAKDYVQYNLGRLIVLFKLNIFFGRYTRRWSTNKYLS